MDLSGILQISKGEFKVMNYENKDKEVYHVSFGDDERMPKCSCFDWNKTGYPCKHFFAVFIKFPCYSWSSLSSLYINSPFLIMDDVFKTKVNTGEKRTLEDHVCSENVNVDDVCELKPKLKRHKSLGPVFRELLKELNTISYLVEDKPDVLDDSIRSLIRMKDELSLSTNKESDIVLEPKKLKERIHEKSNFIPYDLTIRKKRTLDTSRVGSKKEMFDKARKVNVQSQCESNIETEIIMTEDDLEANSFVNSMQPIEIFSEESDYDENISSSNWKSSMPRLSHSDESVIKKKAMLTDSVIHYFQKMMMKQSPFAIGFQDPLLGQNLSFNCIHGDPFVQIIHDGGLHWVTISTNGCKYGEINYYDSLFHHRIKKHVKKQISCLMRCSRESITVNVIPVQQQSNGVDCGIFSIAYASAILNGRNPSIITFDRSKFRSHLQECYVKSCLTDFPEAPSKNQVKFNVHKTISFDIFCTCRMPYFEGDVTNNPQKRMVQCEKCLDWFHQDCENIPDEIFDVFDVSILPWICHSCSLKK